ncbi:MAG: zinc ribbon domain-containing protein [Chloroflexi bacterium]|nr:zinc ribbon domain-containing protein [Chloroflexota bacterium]
MEILIILALVVIVVLIVGYPLINPERYRDQGVRQETLPEYDDLYGARENVFDALRDLQFEFATGKLSTGDYEQLKARYEVQAADILQQIDALKPKKAKPVQGARTCPRCNSAMSAQDKFCTKCGTKL